MAKATPTFHVESVRRWGAAKELSIEPYGLDIVPEFVALARPRLSHWADRIWVGNIRAWRTVGERFDLALIRPEYAPPGRLGDLVGHMLGHVLKPDGCLIVFVGTEEVASRTVEAGVVESGFAVHGRVEVPHPKDGRVVRRPFWIDGAGYRGWGEWGMGHG